MSNRQKERESEERREKDGKKKHKKGKEFAVQKRKKDKSSESTIWLLQTYVMKNFADCEEKLKEVSDQLL